jgi:hypothetical protein
MKKENIFYTVFALTVLLIRINAFVFPSYQIIIDGTRIYHFWIGVILILFVLSLSKSYNMLRTILFPIGLAIVADELIFIIFSNRLISDYWSVYSVSGLVIIMIIIFMYRKKLIDKIYKQ